MVKGASTPTESNSLPLLEKLKEQTPKGKEVDVLVLVESRQTDLDTRQQRVDEWVWFTSFVFAGENGECLASLGVPDMNGGILADLSRGDDVLLFVHRHGDDVIRMFRVELLSSLTNVMNHSRTCCGIDDRLVVSEIEEIVSTIEGAIAVDVIQLEILSREGKEFPLISGASLTTMRPRAFGSPSIGSVLVAFS